MNDSRDLKRQDDAMILDMKERLDTHIANEQLSMSALRKDLQEIKANTSELIDLWKSAKGFITIVSGAGRIIKWLSGTFLALAAIYYAITGKPFK